MSPAIQMLILLWKWHRFGANGLQASVSTESWAFRGVALRQRALHRRDLRSLVSRRHQVQGPLHELRCEQTLQGQSGRWHSFGHLGRHRRRRSIAAGLRHLVLDLPLRQLCAAARTRALSKKPAGKSRMQRLSRRPQGKFRFHWSNDCFTDSI